LDGLIGAWVAKCLPLAARSHLKEDSVEDDAIVGPLSSRPCLWR